MFETSKEVGPIWSLRTNGDGYGGEDDVRIGWWGLQKYDQNIREIEMRL